MKYKVVSSILIATISSLSHIIPSNIHLHIHPLSFRFQHFSTLLFPTPSPHPPPIPPKISIFIPLQWRHCIPHSWDRILNLASQSISDKHIMFHLEHKMQFWSRHNDTVHRDKAKITTANNPRLSKRFTISVTVVKLSLVCHLQDQNTLE